MDDILPLVLLVLAIPVLAIAGFVIALIERGKVKVLTRRVELIEEELRRRPAPPAAAAAPPKAKTVFSSLPPEPEPVAARPSAPDPTAPLSPPPSPPPAPSRPSSGLEETLGTRVAVWVGGLALAVGGIFMVRYSIEQGLVGPGARTTLGAVFALGLLAAGEWLRRGERRSPVAGVPAAHIPSILTAAGTTSAFATLYAAYALYGFLGPATAFVALAVVAIGTMLAAALHGPVLAALGLLAATALPVLVSSNEPSAWALFAHLTFVSAAAFGVARIRGWRWLVAAAGTAAFGWGAAYILFEGNSLDAAALAAYAAAMLALAGLYHASAPLAEEESRRPDWLSGAVAGAFGLFAVPVAVAENHAGASLLLMSLLIAGEVALAAWRPRLAMLLPAAALVAVLGIASFDLAAWLLASPTTVYPLPGEASPLPLRAGTLISTAAALAALIGGAGLALSCIRPAEPVWITGARAGGAVAAPLALLAITYWKVSALAPDLRFAGAAVVLAGAYALLAERFARREADWSGLTAATAALATGAVAALGLALASGLREGFLTMSLAVLSLGIAWVHGSRPIRALPVLAMIAGAVVLARTALDPLMAGDLGTTPIFNALLWGYGLPAAAFAAAAWLFDRQDAPRAASLFEALTLLYVALLLALEIRHFTTGGQIASPSVSLPEVGLQVMTGCLVALGAQRLNLTRPSSVLRYGSMAIGMLSLWGATAGLLFGVNPMVSGDPIGDGLVFNDLLAGYLLPALAAAALCLASRSRRPRWYVLAVGTVAGLLAFAWLTLQVRAVFHGSVLAGGASSEAEWYSYSVAWLIAGIVILVAGAWTGSRELRLGSAVLIVVTVLKVFLSDMSDLEGILRPLSFIGLGAVLVGIGLLYQRLLFPKRRAEPA